MTKIILTEDKVNLLMSEAARMYLNEAKERVQVSRDEIIDLLNKADENPKNAGLFAYVSYAQPCTIYKTKKNWRSDDVASALEASKDRASEDWHKQLTDFNSPDTKLKKNPISNMIVINQWRLNWTTDKNYAKAYGAYSNELSTLRMRMGIALDSDGKLGDNRNQREKTDYGPQFNQTGNLSKDFNMASRKTINTIVLLLDDDGNKIAEIPTNVSSSMMAKPEIKPYANVEAYVKKVITDEDALKAYSEAKAELDRKFKGRTLNLDSILTISANINGVSYFYINDMLDLKKIPVNSTDLIKVGEKLTNASFEDMYSSR